MAETNTQLVWIGVSVIMTGDSVEAWAVGM
jgi:hypothetical protein